MHSACLWRHIASHARSNREVLQECGGAQPTTVNLVERWISIVASPLHLRSWRSFHCVFESPIRSRNTFPRCIADAAWVSSCVWLVRETATNFSNGPLYWKPERGRVSAGTFLYEIPCTESTANAAIRQSLTSPEKLSYGRLCIAL